ncbi:phage tail fiber assembly protein [uncultured Mediterranean phage uvMED]|nr:hypothetical protein [uncultured phage MedDCM-OCT-S04-C26]ADD95641.1 hypothetical protein [uncultured phage MedDCM-OCT-S11-C178]ADD95690.1 hypothetical protein [uncultured phage MedDCM-OCT-S12-C97]BAQ91992.1 phage tail fiber assembly protein [uncultured Mediterranean phage uvMED]BAQ92044.1 phage tail fiber assembly protein [uncultured Mediterranean phage uvMED]
MTSVSAAITSLSSKVEFRCIDNDYDQIQWLNSETQPTKEQVEAEIIRLNNEKPMKLLRAERDKRLAACDWRANSDLTISDDWKTYRQALRDLPASSTPKITDGYLDMTSVTFPTEPS